MIRTLAARLLFALAAACALAASTGVAVPPHDEEPGTPFGHEHALAAYQLIFLIQPTEQDAPILPAIRPGEVSPIQDLAIEFALLILFVAQLRRPALRPGVALVRLPVPSALWRMLPPNLPPRVSA